MKKEFETETIDKLFYRAELVKNELRILQFNNKNFTKPQTHYNRLVHRHNVLCALITYLIIGK